jgi:LmbE family N-acetylglucosaminyl deacetylase
VRIPRSAARAVARLRPRLPYDLLHAASVARSAAGDGPLVGAPPFRDIVVLAAHPDDESAGCGGVMALLAGQGARVRVVVATAGEATAGAGRDEDVGRARGDELRAACSILGAEAPVVLDHPDGHLDEHVEALAADVARVVLSPAPEAIFLPWFLDGHRDHRALSVALRTAGVPAGVELWGYETWTPLPANRLVDITSVVTVKEAALQAHAAAHRAFDVSSILGLNRYRAGYGRLLQPATAAEAFLAAPADEWFRLMDT